MSCFNGRMNEYRSVSLDRFDGNNLKSTVYFLSHCHEDHTQGLESKAFLQRLASRRDVFLYCSEVTKILLLENRKYYLLENFIKTIEIDVPTTIPIPDTGSNKVENVTVTLLHAAHCPGSVMFLFEGLEGTVLYTGDFRWETKHVSRVEALHSGNQVKTLDSLYIDTTFCHPSSLYIPYRQDCANAVYNLVTEWLSKGSNYFVHFTPRANYGHEHLLKDVAERTGFKIHVSPKKASIYRQIPELSDVFTEFGDETPIHACYGEKYSKDRSRLPCGYKLENTDNINIMVILPSTMYFTKKVHLNLTDIVEKKGGIYRVCYSFHSSMIEVRDLVTYLQPKRVRPNVKPIDDKSLSEVQQRLNEFLQIKSRAQLQDDFVVKPLGTLKKSRLTRKRKISVASSDSEGLVFNSPDVKRPKPFEKSPEDLPNGDGDGHADSDEDAHSSYNGSNVDNESELSGISDLEDNVELSTPAQSFLDAIDSQCSQESSEGGKSNSLSYRVCREEDEEQITGSVPAQIEEEDHGESKNHGDEQVTGGAVGQIEEEDPKESKNDGEDQITGSAQAQIEDRDPDVSKNDDRQNVCNDSEETNISNDSDKGEKIELHPNENENCVSRKEFDGQCLNKESDETLVKKDIKISENQGKDTKFERNGSFDLFLSSSSAEGFDVGDVSENDKSMENETLGSVTDRVEDRDNGDSSQTSDYNDKGSKSDKNDYKNGQVVKNTGVKAGFDSRNQNEKLQINFDNQSTKSSQGFDIANLEEGEMELEKCQNSSEANDCAKNLNGHVENEVDDSKKINVCVNGSTHVESEIFSKNVNKSKEESLNSYIEIEDSDDDEIRNGDVESCTDDDDTDSSEIDSDSDETLPPSQNSLLHGNRLLQNLNHNTRNDDEILLISEDSNSNSSFPRDKIIGDELRDRSDVIDLTLSDSDT